MPLSAAEKQRRYRQRINDDPVKRSAYLEKKREQNQKRKNIGEQSKRQQRYTRKCWRNNQRKHRIRVAEEKACTAPDSQTPFNSPPSAQKKRGRKIVRKDRTNCYRENNKLREKIHALNKKYEKIKKRYYRYRKSNSSESPRKSIQRELKGKKVPTPIKKKLIMQETIICDLKSKYASSKKLLKQDRIVSAKVLKKYKLLTIARAQLGGRRQVGNVRPRTQKSEKQIVEKVRVFYLRDDNTRMANGKKQTVTRNKVRKQKRFLLDTVKTLHLKFLSENPSFHISYPLFAKLRPFYVVVPKQSDRDTCLCRIDENLRLMLTKAKNLKVTQIEKLSDIPKLITCDVKSQQCMLRKCVMCKDLCILLCRDGISNSDMIDFFQWNTCKEERQKINESDGSIHKYEVTKAVKGLLTVSFYEFEQRLQELADKFCRHYFNICHQYMQFRKLQTSLQKNEVVVHIDFSENYNLKYSHHIQSAHFGSALKQVTLHTGVLYGLTEEPLSFCTISGNLNHGPPSIWCHLEPILEYIKEIDSAKNTLHFWSDSPSSQYRQKGNFYLLCSRPFEKGYTSATWNFWESGHGRGAPDGVGGALKRTADQLVCNGIDIMTAQDFFNKVQPITKIKLFYISETVVAKAYENIPVLQPVPKTMEIHQVLTTEPLQITYRRVSCFNCTMNRFCECYDLLSFHFPHIQQQHDNSTSHSVDDNRPSEDDSSHVEVKKKHIEPIEDMSDILDKWVIVRYDGLFYPGKVIDINEVGIQINCMNSSGRYQNKFYWPKTADLLIYTPDDIITLMEEPNVLASGHVEIPHKLWSELSVVINQ